MSIAEKLTTIAENVQKVYDAGKDANYNEFWNNYIGTGTISYSPYYFAGQGWRTSNFLPNKNLIFKSAATGLFRQCMITNLKQNLEKCNVTMDTSQTTNLQYAFAYSKITHLPKISLVGVSSNTDYIFAGTSGDRGRIVSIDELEVAATTTIKSTAFNYCSDLTHLIMSGTLAKNGLDLHWSTGLDKESLLSIINALQDKTSEGGTWTVTLGTENLAKLTDAEIAIATEKGWTLA